MRLRGLVLFPIAFAVLFIILAVWLKDSSGSLYQLVMGQRILVRILALAGCLWAISVFERGDELRHAWGWLALNTALVLTRDLLLVTAVLPSDDLQWLNRGLVVASNIALPVGVWLLVHSWKRAALDLMGNRSWAIILGVALVALVVTGLAAYTSFRALLSGNGDAVIFFSSSVGDIVAFCMLGPLLVAALELRGGLLSWPWGLVAACLFSWLLFDAAAWLEPSLALHSFPLREVFRGLASNLLCAGGMAQAMVVNQVRRIAR